MAMFSKVSVTLQKYPFVYLRSKNAKVKSNCERETKATLAERKPIRSFLLRQKSAGLDRFVPL